MIMIASNVAFGVDSENIDYQALEKASKIANHVCSE